MLWGCEDFESNGEKQTWRCEAWRLKIWNNIASHEPEDWDEPEDAKLEDWRCELEEAKWKDIFSKGRRCK